MVKYQVINRYDMQNRLKGVSFYENGRVNQLDSHGYSYLEARELLSKNQEVGLETLPINIVELHFEVTGRYNHDLERILNMLNNKENKLR